MEDNGEDEVAEGEDEEGGFEDLEDGAAEEEVHLILAGGALEEVVLVDPVLYAEGDDEAGRGERHEVGVEGAGVDLQNVVGVAIDHCELRLFHLAVELQLEHVHLRLVAVLEELGDGGDDGRGVDEVERDLDHR